MSRRLPISRAKARLAELVRRAEAGESIVLTRHGRPVASLGPAALQGTGASGDAVVREPAGRYEAERPGAPGAEAPPAVERRREALKRFLEDSIWGRLPEDQLGSRLDKREREKILGYGSDGV